MKKIFLTITAIIAVSAYGISFASTPAQKELNVEMPKVNQNEEFKMPPNGEFMPPPPPKGEFRGHDRGNMHKYHPSKAEMEKKKAEFEKRKKQL